EIICRFNSDGGAGAADAGINDGDMNCVFRKIRVACQQSKGSGGNVAGRNLMRDIDDGNPRVDPENDPFHRSHEPVIEAKISGEGDDTHCQRAYEWFMFEQAATDGSLQDQNRWTSMQTWALNGEALHPKRQRPRPFANTQTLTN